MLAYRRRIVSFHTKLVKVVSDSHLWDFNYACDELAKGLSAAKDTIITVAQRFRDRDDPRTLFVLKACPCCSTTDISRFEGRNDVVMVSALGGIDVGKRKVHCIAVRPPFRRNDGRREGSESLEAFAAAWKQTIEKALEIS